MWFIGVEAKQETSVPPPKKNPGSVPDPSPSDPLPHYALLYFVVYIIFSAISSLLGGTNVEGKLYIFRNCSQGNNYYWNDFKCTTVPNRLISYLRPQ